jgi:predicted DNA binding CopG/RHH family protein
MSKKTKYTAESIKAEVVPDFLPAPRHLVMKEEGVKVTISLSRRSIDFFKAAAGQHNTSYQRMIRRLLDSYTDRYHGDLTTRSSGRSKLSRRST